MTYSQEPKRSLWSADRVDLLNQRHTKWPNTLGPPYPRPIHLRASKRYLPLPNRHRVPISLIDGRCTPIQIKQLKRALVQPKGVHAYTLLSLLTRAWQDNPTVLNGNLFCRGEDLVALIMTQHTCSNQGIVLLSTNQHQARETTNYLPNCVTS